MGALWWLFPAAAPVSAGGSVEHDALLGDDTELKELDPPAEAQR
jgi:hypothetical protein